MTVHKLMPLNVAHTTIFIVEAFGRTYIPLRTLIESTIGMKWQSQLVKLKRMETRWNLRTITTQAASGKILAQPSIHMAGFDAYLWSLRPLKEDARRNLEAIQDGWQMAMLSRFSVEDTENIGTSIVLRIIEKSNKSLVQRVGELEREVKRLESLPRNPVELRYNKPLIEEDKFIRIVDLVGSGMNHAAVAREVGCSRTLVSLFMSGKYRGPEAAQNALHKLAEKGWNPQKQLTGDQPTGD